MGHFRTVNGVQFYPAKFGTGKKIMAWPPGLDDE